jgi:hypothetical protein
MGRFHAAKFTRTAEWPDGGPFIIFIDFDFVNSGKH